MLKAPKCRGHKSSIRVLLAFLVGYANIKTNKDMAKKNYTYKPQYGVIVICESETQQKRVFEKLKKEGLKLKIVNV